MEELVARHGVGTGDLDRDHRIESERDLVTVILSFLADGAGGERHVTVIGDRRTVRVEVRLTRRARRNTGARRSRPALIGGALPPAPRRRRRRRPSTAAGVVHVHHECPRGQHPSPPDRAVPRGRMRAGRGHRRVRTPSQPAHLHPRSAGRGATDQRRVGHRPRRRADLPGLQPERDPGWRGARGTAEPTAAVHGAAAVRRVRLLRGCGVPRSGVEQAGGRRSARRRGRPRHERGRGAGASRARGGPARCRRDGGGADRALLTRRRPDRRPPHAALGALVGNRRRALRAERCAAGSPWRRVATSTAMPSLPPTQSSLQPIDPTGVGFARELRDRLGDRVCCIPVVHGDDPASPTTIGLGDTFVGGFLAALVGAGAVETSRHGSP